MAVIDVCSIRDVFEVLERGDAAGVADDSLASVVLGLQVLQNWVEAKAAVLEERTHACTGGAGRGAGETGSGVASHARNACRRGGG